MTRSHPGHELLDLPDEAVDITDDGRMVFTGQLHEASAVDVIGDVAAHGNRDDPVPAPVQHQSRDRDGTQEGPHVPDVGPSDQGLDLSGARDAADALDHPLPERWVRVGA